MLKIRWEQIEAFQKSAIQDFENEMVWHIEEFAPKQSEIIGEQGVREVVKLGIERAKKYGLTNRGPISFYIELMFMLGSDFDTDPQYPWMTNILNDTKIEDQMERADYLYAMAMDYVEKVTGPENIHEKEALQRAIQIKFEDLPISEDNFEKEVLEYLCRIHPQKFNCMAESSFITLIQRGDELSKSYNIQSLRGKALFVSLMFTFGHGCFSDPQFPWMPLTLNKLSIRDPNKRVEQLYSKLMTYFKKAIILIEKG